MKCPMPLVMAKTAIEELASGDVLIVLATDPEAGIDLAAWATDHGHEMTEADAGGWREFTLTKA